MTPSRSGLERPAAEVAAAAAGVTVAADHLAALEEARRFRLARHAVSAEQIERLRRDLPLPHLLVPALDAGLHRAGRDPGAGRRAGGRRGVLVPEGAA